MYIPKHFQITDDEEIYSFIQAHAFGQLVSNVNGRIFATHIPFLLSEDRTKLLAHVAKQNPQHEELAGQEALIIFAGPHDYVSPSWYRGKGVPTWNYQAVHVYGKCTVFEDSETLKHVVDSLTEKYEAGFDQPWQSNYPAPMLKGIVGIEISILELQCKYKLSQNRPEDDQAEVINQLELLGADELALAMRRNR